MKDDNLTLLIQSLTMSEKRYFKLFSEKHIIGESNKYVLLFDYICKNTNSNELEIKEYFEANNFSGDYISSDKNYLFNLILRSLTEFHHQKTYNLEIKKLLESIEILFHKGLYQICLKLIAKAEKLTIACENFSLMLDILNWKKKCFGYSFGIDKAKLVNEEMDVYLEKQLNLKQITNIYYESYLLKVKFDKYPNETINEFDELLKNDLMSNYENALSLNAKIFYNLTFSHYYFVKNENENEYHYIQKTIDLIHTSTVYRIENPLDYISIYNRLLSLKKYYHKESFNDDIIILREFSNQIEFRKEIVMQRVFIHTYTAELEFLLTENEYKMAEKRISEIEIGILKLSFPIEPMYMIQFFYLYSVCLKAINEGKKALKFINKTLNEFQFQSNPLYFVKTEIINILTHYELKNFDLVTSLVKNFKRKYKNDIHIQEIELKLLKLLSSHSNNPNKKSKIKQEFKFILEEPEFNLQSPNFFIENYKKWIQKQIEKL